MTTYATKRRGSATRWTVILAVIAVTASLLVPSVAMADRSEGLEALRNANDAFDEENFEEAYDHYEEAYEILGVEMIVYRLGQTAEELGWAEEAVAHYEEYRRIGDDEEFLSRIDEAMPGLRDQLVVTVEVISEPEGATVKVVEPSEEFEDEEAPVTLKLDPGTVEVSLEKEGYDEERLEMWLEAGDEFVWEVTLQESDEEPEPIAGLDDPDDEEPVGLAEFEDVEATDDDSSLGMWGWSTTGVGVSLLAFGGVMSLMQSRTTDEVNALDRAAVGAETESFDERENLRQEQQALRDDAQTYYRLSTGAFIAGGVLTAAGAGLLIHGAMGSGDDDADGGLSFRGALRSDGGMIGIGGRF